ncbi:MAG: pseudouridine synthase [Planctomycetota bacterium]|nr:MAG: pseudouridine synthase [Planctomycetota bacterium]
MSPRKAKPDSEPQALPRKKSPTTKKSPESEPPVAELQRINKVLAAAGLGSRRHVDELIEQGRVEIDGKVVTQVGIKVDMSTASISVDGELLKQYRPVYFAVHKPEGVLCTNRDPQGRLRVIDFVPNQFRLFPVGRLDAFSTGLIILTNDGELAQQLTHPKHEIPKRYSVIVAGQVELEALKRLERGIYLAEGKAQVDHAKLKKVRKSSTEIEITLSEGKNREIRRVLARLGHKVVSLKRIAIGPLKLSDLPEGAYRPLSNHEVQGLYQAVEEIRRERKAARKARKKLASANQEPESAEQDPPRARSPKSNAPHGNKPLAKSPQANLSDRKSTKAPKERSWEKLPSLAQNPFATEEDLDDDDRTDDQSQAELGQSEPLILVRDLGPSRPSRKDSDEEFFFMPRRPAGTVIGQEEATESDGFEFELNDPDDDLFEDESFDPDDSEPPARGPKGKRPAGKAGGSRPGKSSPGKSSPGKSSPGKPRAGNPRAGNPRTANPSDSNPRAGNPRAGSRRSDRADLADSQNTRESRQDGPRQDGPRQGAPNRGRPSRPRTDEDRTSPSGPRSGSPKRGGPRMGGPKSGGPKRGSPKSGGPKRGGPKSSGPKSSGPKRGGPKSGGPKRGGGRGRSKS